ncbi:MAG: carbohydrate kinase family protein [Candidatus Aenigmatarchaeota archaeon]
MADIVGIGALNEDVIYTIKPGIENELMMLIEKESRMHVEQFENYLPFLNFELKRAGGSAANTITDLSARGWNCSFIGELGNDETGKFMEDSLKDHKIELIITKIDGQTGSCGIILHEDGKYSVLFKEGVSDDIKINDKLIKTARSCKLFHSSPFASFKSPDSLKTQVALAKEAKKAGAIVSVSPGRLYAEVIAQDKNSENGKLITELLSSSDIIFINKNEKYLLSGYKNREKASKKILDEFRPKVICITLGKQGCYVKTKKEGFLLPAENKKIVSTLGAGDAFAAGFLNAYLKGKNVHVCAEEGNKFANLRVENIDPKKYLLQVKLQQFA